MCKPGVKNKGTGGNMGKMPKGGTGDLDGTTCPNGQGGGGGGGGARGAAGGSILINVCSLLSFLIYILFSFNILFIYSFHFLVWFY